MLGKEVKVKLKNGSELIVVPDCICWLSNESDPDTDDEVLKFDIIGSTPVFISENEIETFSIVE